MAQTNSTTAIEGLFKLRSQIEETYRLVYFDIANENERLSEALKCQLREIINQMSTVETISECERLIEERINDDIVLIINCPNSNITEEIINRTSHYRHVSTIYIIDHHKGETTAISKYSKVINIHIEDLVSQFVNHQAYRQQQQPSGVAFQDQSTNSTTEIFGILQSIDMATRRVGYPTPDTSEKFLLALREHYAGNNRMLNKVAKFEREYTPEQALWWYTAEPFIYDIVNKTFRTQNFRAVELLSFFIRDIHAQLSDLHQNSTQKNIIHLYRGQAMSRIEVNNLKSRIGEIVSMNSFLSTSGNQDVALGFALASIDGRPDADEVNAVLFEIEADPHLAKYTPFANISRQSVHPDEDEYLFHLNSLFRLIAIEDDQYAENITNIRLLLTSLPSRQDDEMAKATRTEILSHMDDIGRMAIDMVDSMHNFRSSNRETRLRKLLDDIKNSNQSNKHAIFIENGDEAVSYYQYLVAIDFYREALLIDPSNVRTWLQIARSYHNLTDHEQAISACRRAIDLNTINGNFLSGCCHYLLGMSLSETGKTKEALLELEKTINIVISIEMHDGDVISDKDRGSPRLDSLCFALDKYTISGKKPQLLVNVYEQMAIAYETLSDAQQSLIWFQKALDICSIIKMDVAKFADLEKRIEHIMSNTSQ